MPLPFPLRMESASYVFSLRVVIFYLVTTGWIFDISAYVRIQSANQSIIIFVVVVDSRRLPCDRTAPQMVFSIMRSTEPYLDVYFSEAGNIDAELQQVGFSTVSTEPAGERSVVGLSVVRRTPFGSISPSAGAINMSLVRLCGRGDRYASATRKPIFSRTESSKCFNRRRFQML